MTTNRISWDRAKQRLRLEYKHGYKKGRLEEIEQKAVKRVVQALKLEEEGPSTGLSDVARWEDLLLSPLI